MLSTVPTIVTHDQNLLLIAPFTAAEVTVALFQMNPYKAPGLDDHVNDTLVVLIPKQKQAERIEQFRPISLSGVMAKTISKALVNRLQCFIDTVISPAQTAFIKNRIITDNYLIAHETSHYTRNVFNDDQVYGSLKLDMSKAYDRIEWLYLKNILLQLGFEASWVSKIMKFVTTTVTYRLKINGCVSDQFLPHRGLRQGDPLSPYLFILCTEWLSRSLYHLHTTNCLIGIRVCRSAPSITHLLFADDSILYFKADNSTPTVLQKLLADYERLSGQLVNFHKSELVLSKNASPNLIDLFHRTLQVKKVSTHSKYLGMPLLLKRKLSDNFSSIVDLFGFSGIRLKDGLPLNFHWEERSRAVPRLRGA
ncbi:unnamed protein product [Rhodiola kirilowii]